LQRIVFLNKAALKDFDGAEKQAVLFFNLNDEKNKYTSNDYSSFGDVLRELNKDSLALVQYEKAVEVNPEKIDLIKQLSSAYNSMKKYEKAAEVYQKLIDSGNYKTNDLYVLAGRYMSHGATETDSLKKVAALENAIKYIDLTLDRVDNDYRITQRKARICIVKNNNKPSEESTACYTTVLALLENEPEKKEARKQDFIEAYNQIAGYYILIGDNAKAKENYLKFLELDPENEALRKYIETIKVEEK
jgi:tetratricopeptide (TPR) repeat protein